MKDERYLQFQEKLKNHSAELSTVKGFCRLNSRIEKVTDWDEFQAIYVQIDITLWFKNKSVLKEIEPKLPDRKGYADILLSFLNQNIYCEVNSLESLMKKMKSKNQNIEKQIQHKLNNQPYLSVLDAENEVLSDKIIRNLLKKTKNQLPENQHCILTLDTRRAAIFHHTVKDIAKKLLPQRPQIIFLMHWSDEKGSVIGNPPFFIPNTNSKYQDIENELFGYLNQDN